jgi:hypothetical protein
VKTNANINYLIMQARDQVNAALASLLSTDSKLSALHIGKLNSQEDASTSEDSSGESEAKENNFIKVGSLKIKSTEGENGEPRKESKRIVFNVKSLRALQGNLGVFSV